MVFSSKNSQKSWQQPHQVRDTKDPRVSRDHHYLTALPSSKFSAVLKAFSSETLGFGEAMLAV